MIIKEIGNEKIEIALEREGLALHGDVEGEDLVLHGRVDSARGRADLFKVKEMKMKNSYNLSHFLAQFADGNGDGARRVGEPA